MLHKSFSISWQALLMWREVKEAAACQKIASSTTGVKHSSTGITEWGEMRVCPSSANAHFSPLRNGTSGPLRVAHRWCHIMERKPRYTAPLHIPFFLPPSASTLLLLPRVINLRTCCFFLLSASEPVKLQFLFCPLTVYRCSGSDKDFPHHYSRVWGLRGHLTQNITQRKPCSAFSLQCKSEFLQLTDLGQPRGLYHMNQKGSTDHLKCYSPVLVVRQPSLVSSSME